MRKKLFSIIEPAKKGDILSYIYDFLMISAIIASLVPLAFKETNIIFQWIDQITVSIFILDYFLRLITADYKIKKSFAEKQ